VLFQEIPKPDKHARVTLAASLILDFARRESQDCKKGIQRRNARHFRVTQLAQDFPCVPAVAVAIIKGPGFPKCQLKELPSTFTLFPLFEEPL
jgi:hypothetical protein